METIPVQKVQALFRSLERLYSAESLKQFASAVFALLGEIIAESIFSLDIVNSKTGEVISETSEDVLMLPKVDNTVVEVVSSDPPIPVVRPHAKGATRPSDCGTRWQFEQPPFYVDAFVAIRVRRQTVFTIDIPGYVLSVTVNRDTDFSDQEAVLLNLAAPHLPLAHQNLHRLESLRASSAQVVPDAQDLERVGLTTREAEVLHWVMKGKQDGAIADILKISVRTVHQHITHILRKLQSESRASASYEAMTKLKEFGSHS
jgi:DNA-binding CsgD family transcriptional regulator